MSHNLHSLNEGGDHLEVDNSRFTGRIFTYSLVHFLKKNPQKITFQAFIPKRGIVTITNIGTINNELKIQIGKDKLLLPDEIPIYIEPKTALQLGITDKEFLVDKSPYKKYDKPLIEPLPELASILDDTADEADQVTGVRRIAGSEGRSEQKESA